MINFWNTINELSKENIINRRGAGANILSIFNLRLCKSENDLNRKTEINCKRLTGSGKAVYSKIRTG